jgi:hypothetical protein
MTNLDAYVCDTAPGKIRVKVINESVSKLLEDYGFRYEADLKDWSLSTTPDQQAAAYVFLRDNQICFANGPAGWPPGAVFEHWREQGLLSGMYLSVSWRDKDNYYIEEK